MLGRKEEAQKASDNYQKQSMQEYVPATMVVDLCFKLGDKEEGFKWLDKAYQERDIRLAQYLKTDPVFYDLSNDSRYISLLQKMDLEPRSE
jgi:hypothetical protein